MVCFHFVGGLFLFWFFFFFYFGRGVCSLLLVFGVLFRVFFLVGCHCAVTGGTSPSSLLTPGAAAPCRVLRSFLPVPSHCPSSWQAPAAMARALARNWEHCTFPVLPIPLPVLLLLHSRCFHEPSQFPPGIPCAPTSLPVFPVSLPVLPPAKH